MPEIKRAGITQLVCSTYLEAGFSTLLFNFHRSFSPLYAARLFGSIGVGAAAGTEALQDAE